MGRPARQEITAPLRRRLPLAILAAAGLLAAPAVPAQVFLSKPPYVPTPQSTVDRMLELARVGPEDFVVDLGSGDGRIVITAAQKYGARGVGIEIEPDLVNLSQYYARRAGVADRAKFVTEDLFVADLRPATVLTLYLFRELNIKLRPRILEQLRPGARVVAHDWDLGDEWEPDFAETIPAPDKPVGIDRNSRIYLWYVPAKVAGRWRLETPLVPGRSATLALAQEFQKFAGELELDGARYTIAGGRARGTTVRFTVPAGSPLAGAYEGTVAGAQIRGEIRRDGLPAAPFTANRP
jgi:SAM-dependent methyltransferase